VVMGYPSCTNLTIVRLFVSYGTLNLTAVKRETR
jgi:hypothetical protein